MQRKVSDFCSAFPSLCTDMITVSKQNGSAKVKSYVNDEAAFRTDLFNDYAAHDKMTDMMRQFLRDGAATKAALKKLLQSK